MTIVVTKVRRNRILIHFSFLFFRFLTTQTNLLQGKLHYTLLQFVGKIQHNFIDFEYIIAPRCPKVMRVTFKWCPELGFYWQS